MNCMENFKKVAHALLKMYPVKHEVHQWLELQVGYCNALASTIYEVGCFLKSQKKGLHPFVTKSCFICGFVGSVLSLDGGLTGFWVRPHICDH